ncbi:hydrolase [Flavobacteriaceae bacterium R38]|nr:hydrolase [Flavobacteriaceae bacterium R38]
MLKKVTVLIILLITLTTAAQNTQKTIKATRIDNPPKIDGKLDDDVWKDLPSYGDFYMLQPNNTGKERETHKTEVKMAYDDKAVYFAVYLYDNEPDRILKQFSQRDNIFVQADNFSININTLNDGINETNFYVTSAGTIGDSRGESGNEDFSFNVVFQCNISSDDKGWYAEYKIPYNALRFPEVDVQNWSINFFRRIVHLNETYSWNYVDRQVGARTLYNGLVTGVENINPPLRLILFPFTQASGSTFDGEDETNFSAGLDIKYGITDNFTLDATLIPDFGQAAFDNVELNLGPFEQIFSENRQFFTEGTELFDRGGLFFSRRIGNTPTQRNTVSQLLEENEVIDDNPDEVGLLNAIKISGRTKNKLGIGFLNAITEETEARVRDTLTGETRGITTESLANYNIVVLDQQFNQNSSVTLINTNVTRAGSFRDGNVTGLLANLSNKKNSYNVNGGIRYSQVREDGNTVTGIRTNLGIRKTKGNFRWRLNNFLADDTYDSNDLGILFRNNFNNFLGEVSYEIFEPTKRFNRYRLALRFNHRRLFRPSVLTRNSVSFNSFFSTPERFSFGLNADYNSDEDDYFEPRIDGRFVTFSSNARIGGFVSSDFRKKFAYDINFNYRKFFADPQEDLSIRVSPRYRFSDNFLVIWSSDFSRRDRNFGYITDDGTDVFLGQRDITSLENSLQASYNFDSYKAINLRFRNFWSTANYNDNIFFILNDDGSRSVTDFDTSEDNPNTNFNIWNVDLSFNWRFAPGSEAVLLYRNEIFNRDDQSQLNYTESLSNLFDQPIRHTLSLRIVYFLDVNNLKNVFKG